MKLSVSVPDKEWEALELKCPKLGPSALVQMLVSRELTPLDMAAWHRHQAEVLEA